MNLLAKNGNTNLIGRDKDDKKQKYPGHLKLMQDLKSVRAKIEVSTLLNELMQFYFV